MIEHIVLTLLFAGVPTLTLWIFYHQILMKKTRTLLKLLLIGVPYAILADNAAAFMGIWDWNRDKILGIYIWLMPIDDLIFFIVCALAIFSFFFVFKEKFGAKQH